LERYENPHSQKTQPGNKIERDLKVGEKSPALGISKLESSMGDI
jgi:hypothetical protein